MAVADTEGYWDIVVSSLQDICNANESLTFDNIYDKYNDAKISSMSNEQLESLREDINDHAQNIGTAKRIIETSQQNLQVLTASVEKAQLQLQQQQEQEQQEQEQQSTPSRNQKGQVGGKAGRGSGKKGAAKTGRLYWVSKFDPSGSVVVGSEVAFKLKNRHFEEWIQCEVTKISQDGTKYEIRDPEPDENNNPGQTFKASYKEILLIATPGDAANLRSYTYGAKVLARYPETTTFYPAVVVGQKKDGIVRLKFDGEEEVNKETEVERRLVLPFPER